MSDLDAEGRDRILVFTDLVPTGMRSDLDLKPGEDLEVEFGCKPYSSPEIDEVASVVSSGISEILKAWIEELEEE